MVSRAGSLLASRPSASASFGRRNAGIVPWTSVPWTYSHSVNTSGSRVLRLRRSTTSKASRRFIIGRSCPQSAVRTSASSIPWRPPRKNPPGRGNGVVRPERAYPLACTEPREPARTENIGRLPAERGCERTPFVEEATGAIHGELPVGLDYMSRLSRLEGGPSVRIGWWHVAKFERDRRALGLGNVVREGPCSSPCSGLKMLVP